MNLLLTKLEQFPIPWGSMVASSPEFQGILRNEYGDVGALKIAFGY